MHGPQRRVSNLALRVITAAVGIPLVLAIDFAGGAVVAAAIGLTAAAGTLELYGLFRGADFRPVRLVGVPLAVALAIAPAFGGSAEAAWVGLVLAALVCSALYTLAFEPDRRRLLDWALTVAGCTYVGLLLGQLTLLRGWERGAWWVLLVLLMTWAYDTGAYFGGKLFGRRPFMQHISARKTVEGVQGGLLLSTLAGLAGVPALGLQVLHALVLGLVCGVAAQTGDLIESMIKRQTGAKDSGSIMPGHGGLLDRIDSLLLTGVVVVYAARAFGYGA